MMRLSTPATPKGQKVSILLEELGLPVIVDRGSDSGAKSSGSRGYIGVWPYRHQLRPAQIRRELTVFRGFWRRRRGVSLSGDGTRLR